MRVPRRSVLQGFAIAALPWPALPAFASAAEQLRPFGFDGVRLLSSRWQRQTEEVLDYYLAVPDDNYLMGFRRRAGFPAPGAELGGWYSADVFNPFGQIVSGLARLGAATGRSDARAKAVKLATEFVRCLEPDGYFFYSDRPNARHYGYDKALCGLLDAYLYAGYADGPNAMRRITAWGRDPANLERSNRYANLSTEWYTLSENLYRAQIATGDASFGDFARVWEYRAFWDRFYREENCFQNPDGTPRHDYHAYSHVNTLSGLGAASIATGDPYYLTALRNAYELVGSTQAYATGGYGPYEGIVDDRAALRRQLHRGHAHFETQCGSWAVFKLAKYLLTLTGDARFGDWAEQLVYNGVGASRQSGPDGAVQYFSDYSSHGGTKYLINPWSCCSGTRPQAVAAYSDLVYFHGARGLHVNLFLPSTIAWDHPDGRLSARLDTRFPDDGVVRLQVQRAPSSAVGIAFRSPAWLDAAPVLRVNGKPVDVTTDALHWLRITRTWRAGDAVELVTSAGPRYAPFDSTPASPRAVVHGPVVLAAAGSGNPASVFTGTRPPLRRVGPDLRYEVEGHPEITVQPFYAYGPDERYVMYLDSRLGAELRFQGAWSQNVWFSFTRSAGSAVEWNVTGTAFQFLWRQFDDAGLARVLVDGAHVADVDQYGPVREVPDATSFTGLPAGNHRVRIECTGRRSDRSRDVYINVVDLTPL